MSTNFMEAGTEIEGLVDKIDAIITKAANEVAEAILDRVKNGKANNTLEVDVANLVKSFPVEYQNKIYLKVITVIAKNVGGSKNPKHDNSPKRRNDIFANRGF